MKATLEFNLPEERIEHLQAVHAGALVAVIDSMDEFLRNAWKYGHKYKTADEALAKTREHLREQMIDSGYNFDEG